ncbi:hypothetical protein D4764_03G0002840 [Takifugu flavidus]|uniref:Ig-like domain-containing protein n=1 Tax=Takifugu flavidus TaxID=433684 RepID=A0A5C6N7D0_9TELE|nr:hypothetical protein D4764_03G0002840 [Takifugu flavidus]
MLKNMLGLLPHPFPSAARLSLIKVAWLSHSCRITMKRLDLFTALLCSLSWIFISGSGPETVEVRQGEDVTLACSNTSTEQSQTIWFRLVNRTKPNAIASMFTPTQKALICPGFDKTKFNMTSNISTIFVHIMRADLSDSGLYFCGIYGQKCIEFSAVTFLNVTQFQDGEDDKLNDLNESQNQCSDTSPKLNIILSGLCILLTIIIIALAFKVKNLKSVIHLAWINISVDSMVQYLDATEHSLKSMEEIPGDRRNRMSTARALQNDLQQATGVNVSDQTIRNRLHVGGLRARRPVVGPLLTAQHRGTRLAFAIDHQNWQLRHWCPVLFTDDESRFNLSTCNRRESVCRCRGEHYAACNIIQHDRFGGGSVMLVQWDLGSSWSTTMPDLMWLEYAGSSWRMKELMPLTGHHVHLT